MDLPLQQCGKITIQATSYRREEACLGNRQGSYRTPGERSEQSTRPHTEPQRGVSEANRPQGGS